MSETLSNELMDQLISKAGLAGRAPMVIMAFKDIMKPNSPESVMRALKQIVTDERYPCPADLQKALGAKSSWEDSWSQILPLVRRGLLSSNPELYDELSDLETTVVKAVGFRIREYSEEDAMHMYRREHQAEERRRSILAVRGKALNTGMAELAV